MLYRRYNEEGFMTIGEGPFWSCQSQQGRLGSVLLGDVAPQILRLPSTLVQRLEVEQGRVNDPMVTERGNSHPWVFSRKGVRLHFADPEGCEHEHQEVGQTGCWSVKWTQAGLLLAEIVRGLWA